MRDFVHLHVHTQYSILDGASSIHALICKAKADGMKAVAITDHGNMFGAKEFHEKATKNGVKPIIGCEVYVAHGSRFDRIKEHMRGTHLILLAKNKTGYHNLIKLVSHGYIDGFYSRPRIDKEILQQYKEGIIVSTACIGGEIPRAIRENNLDKARELILEFKEWFGDDFYLEMQRHETRDPNAAQIVFEKQKQVNEHLVNFSRELGVKLIATNDVHFVNEEDAEAHDRLICLNTGADLDDPKRMRYTKQEWFKTRDEMSRIFADLPEVLENTVEIANKVEEYQIDSVPIMPDFPLPAEFQDADAFLRHLAYQGAEKRYPEITPEIRERIDFELEVIQRMGFPGYFLIVQDFLNAARDMGVSVGPGRGSAAGSVVAYCLRITDIDPLKYDLLFERFLNPDRISMPDIDIDFDDDGRELVLKYVNDKYGKNRVAHIITFGTMAAKMAIRDVARVQKLPLFEADRLAKLVPEGPKVSLDKAFKEVKELAEARDKGEKLVMDTLKYAEILEGSVRQTGIHACGIIIGREDLVNYIPLSISKDKEQEVLVTQFEGKYVESVGMLKMDFLGLKTLSIIKDALENIRKSKGIVLDIDTIPLDDLATYELYSRGETTGTFQFESDGMKKYLRELKPNKFEDLIAMNALYRPGPMEYIPNFVARKHGREKIEYDFPIMEQRLKDTYGITVYQEQVMLLSRDMAGFSRGDSDKLRKAMGKKQRDVMDNLKVKFIEGCKSNNLDEKRALKVWTDWEKFAEYAFNKSHSTCYSYVAYQTAYLKANYPPEYMAAVLSRNISDIKKITVFMDECKRMGIQVLTPDVNESELKFTVNKQGNIRFGMGAIKGVGENAVECIIEERRNNGPYKDIYNLVERVNLNAVNRKNLEALALSGGLDGLGIKRSQYFATDAKESTFLENLVRYGNRVQADKNSKQNTLFGMGGGMEIEVLKPEAPACEDWTMLKTLNSEKELIGIYLSAHPLDPFRLEIDHFCSTDLARLNDLATLNGRDITFAGIITEVKNATTKNGKPYGSIVIEDFTDSLRLMFFSNDYLEFSKFFTVGYSLMFKAKVQPRPFNEKELEIKVKQISMLANVREEMVKSLSIIVPVQKINDELIADLKAHTDSQQGKVQLKFKVYDPVENIMIEMYSRGKRVDLTNELVACLKNYDDIEFKLN